jgi:hypothetical protein
VWTYFARVPSSVAALKDALVAERAHCAKVRQELLDQLKALADSRTFDIANLKKTIAQHDVEAKAREQALVEQLKFASTVFVSGMRNQPHAPTHTPNIQGKHSTAQSAQEAATNVFKRAERAAVEAKRKAQEAIATLKKAKYDAQVAEQKRQKALEVVENKRKEEKGNGSTPKPMFRPNAPSQVGPKDVDQAKGQESKFSMDAKAIATSIEYLKRRAAKCTADIATLNAKLMNLRHVHDQARKVLNFDNQGQIDRLHELSLQVAAADAALKRAKQCVQQSSGQITVDEDRKKITLDDLNQARNIVTSFTIQVESADLSKLAGTSPMGCWIDKEHARLFPRAHGKVTMSCLPAVMCVFRFHVYVCMRVCVRVVCAYLALSSRKWHCMLCRLQVGGGFKGAFLPDSGIITDCKAKAVAHGDQLFALHRGEFCFSGPSKVDFQKYGPGPVADCSAHGGKATVQVYTAGATTTTTIDTNTGATRTATTDHQTGKVTVTTGAAPTSWSSDPKTGVVAALSVGSAGSLKTPTGVKPSIVSASFVEEEFEWEDADDDEYEESDIRTTLAPRNNVTTGTVNVKIAIKNMITVIATGTNKIKDAQAAVKSTQTSATAAATAADDATQVVSIVTRMLHKALLNLTLAQVKATANPTDSIVAATLTEAKRIAGDFKKKLEDAKRKEREALKNVDAARTKADKKKGTLQVVAGQVEVAVNTAILNSALANLTLAVITNDGVDDAKKKVADAKKELADSQSDLKDTKTLVKNDLKVGVLERRQDALKRKEEEARKRNADEVAEQKKLATIAAEAVLQQAQKAAEERAAALKAAEEAAKTATEDAARKAAESAKARAAVQVSQAASLGANAAYNQAKITKSVVNAVQDGPAAPPAIPKVSGASATAPPVPHGSTPAHWEVPSEADAAKALEEAKAVIASTTKAQDRDKYLIKAAEARGKTCAAHVKDLEAQLKLAQNVRDQARKVVQLNQPDIVKALHTLSLQVAKIDATLKRARECIVEARTAQLQLERRIADSKARAQGLQPFVHNAEADLLAAQAKVGRAGCWNLDTKLWNVAFETSHGKVGGSVLSALKFDKGVITECMEKAKKNGHIVFGLHNGNQCTLRLILSVD